MEKATKIDLKALEAKLQAYELEKEQNDAQMAEATVDNYIPLLRRRNEILIKIMVTEEAISRICDKNFSKNKPEFVAIPAAGSNLTRILR